MPRCPAIACPPRTRSKVNAVKRNKVFTALIISPINTYANSV
jgi:hypothetical protein